MLEDGDGIDLVQCYNPRTDAWTELAPMLIARSGSAACVLNGHIFIIGKCQLHFRPPVKKVCFQWTAPLTLFGHTENFGNFRFFLFFLKCQDFFL